MFLVVLCQPLVPRWIPLEAITFPSPHIVHVLKVRVCRRRVKDMELDHIDNISRRVAQRKLLWLDFVFRPLHASDFSAEHHPIGDAGGISSFRS